VLSGDSWSEVHLPCVFLHAATITTCSLSLEPLQELPRISKFTILTKLLDVITKFLQATKQKTKVCMKSNKHIRIRNE